MKYESNKQLLIAFSQFGYIRIGGIIMSTKTNEKIQVLKIIEKKRRKQYLIFGIFLGLTSGCAIAYCLSKHTNHSTSIRFKKEKEFYCSKFNDIKDAICDMKNHLQKNPCCIDVDTDEAPL